MADPASSATAISDLIQKHEECITNRADRVSKSELSTWQIDEVASVLEQVTPRAKTRGSNDPCGPDMNRASSMIDWMFTFVKAPIVLVKQSIQMQAALCVNRLGKFQVRRQGYAVMSHVWGETCGWNTPTSWGPVEPELRKKGIIHRHFVKFFDRCEAEWLWVDVLAMPEVFDDMTVAEKHEIEEMRTGVINCLRNIYTNADKVVVLDSFLLRLHSGGMIDVAVILCLGRWMTRLWPLTEAKLARKLILKTEDSSFDLDEMLTFLYEQVQNDDHRYSPLFSLLTPLRPVPPGHTHISGLPDLMGRHLFLAILIGGENRLSDVDIDQARALFPLLGLRWQTGWTLQQGLKHIARSHPDDVDILKRYCEYRGIDYDG